MAKQLVNPVERHVEKAVVGVAALLLIAVVARFFLTSPNQMEMGDETVTPATMDARIADRAEEILDLILNADADVTMPDPLHEEFVAVAARLEAPVLPGVAPLGPDVPLIDPPIEIGGHASLVTVLKPERPATTFGRSTLVFIGPDGNDRYMAANWTTVAAVFDVKGQTELQRHAYGAARGRVVVVPPQLQRRSRRPDGTWSDEDWADVASWPAAVLPTTPELDVSEQDGESKVSPEALTNLDRFTRTLAGPELGREMLRPIMPDVANGTRWAFPSLVPYKDVLRQDERMLYPEDAPSQNPPDLYGLDTDPTEADKAGAGPAVDEITVELDAADRLYNSVKRNFARNVCGDASYNDAMTAHNMAFEVWKSREASPVQKRRAGNLQRNASQLAKDVDRKIKMGQCAGGRGPIETGEKKGREPLPTQLVWVHDSAEGSLLDDRTYQYRMRFRILNQLAGEPEKLDDRQDASRIFVLGDWSEPSDPITFEPSFLYFVISDEPAKEKIGVEFFRWYDGQWVKGRRTKFGIGAKLQMEQRCEVRSLLNPDEVDNALVEFSADATVIDMDFDREYRERRKGTGKQGVRFGPARSECSVVLVDSAGKLYERFVPTDKNHPEKRRAASR